MRNSSEDAPPRGARKLARGGLLAALVCLAACATSFQPIADPIGVRVGTIDATRLEATLNEVPERNEERIERVAELFQQAGCGGEMLRVAMPGLTRYPNVICTLPGESRKTILVGAHVDRPPEGKGIVDNWTAASLLPHLYRALAVQRRHHSFLFVGFGQVALKQQSSKGFLRRLGEEKRERIRAMVNIKGLGLGPTAIWGTQADRNLRQDLFAVAKALGLPLESVRFYKNINVDSKSFIAHGIPAITIHSFSPSNAQVLSQPGKDREVSQVDLGAYYDSARLLAAYLAYLDDTLDLRDQRRNEKQPEAS
jgi:hypothetical protein